MKPKRSFLSTFLLTVVFLLAAEAPPEVASSAPAKSTESGALDIDATLVRMTLEQKVGQLFLINIVGRDAPVESSAEVLRSVPVGAIILFSYNLKGAPTQVAQLTGALQEIARTSHAQIPYLIAVDQEGGRVQRLKRGFTSLPSPRTMGQLPGPKLERLGGAVARQLLAVGINMNLAPVVEASAGEEDVIADRGFAASAVAAAPLAAAFIRGTQAAGVVATAKHFPGNAGSVVDPHKGMPTLSLDRSAIESRLLPPFRSAIEAGVDAVMISHVEIPALDDQRPVALSPAVVDELLRGALSFQGVVCSDDLLMKAVTEKFDPAVAAVLAIAAGNDLLMVSNPKEVPRLHRAVVQAVQEKRLPEPVVDAAVRRLLLMKQRRDLWDSADRLRAGDSLKGLSRARRDARRLLSHIEALPPGAEPPSK